MAIRIVPYDALYAAHFKSLNIEWLETYFYVEAFDNEVLSNPEQYIIKPGGHIFFVLENQTVLGTVALLKMDNNIFELTKMAVLPAARGKRIGQQLMEHCIDFAKAQKWGGLLLYSNKILENAIHIYRKYGFEEIPLAPDNPYERSNIKMFLKL
ncbi:MAG: GNAT family N-acetyltransferase [Gilvibacter sp.]